MLLAAFIAWGLHKVIARYYPQGLLQQPHLLEKSQPIARTEIETYIRNRMEACERLAPVANKFYQAQNAFMIASLACLILTCKESMSNTFITILVFYASICLYNLSDAFQEYIHNRTYYRDFDARIRDVLDIFYSCSIHFVLSTHTLRLSYINHYSRKATSHFCYSHARDDYRSIRCK